MEFKIENLRSRYYANPLDKPIPYEGGTHGVDPSPDAPSGCNGIGWVQVFEDGKTGELYKVHCSDGVYRSKDAYADKDVQWMDYCFNAIIERTHAEAEAGAKEVYISRNEWNLMRAFRHTRWLDPKEGEKYAQGDCSLDEGLIGYCKGVPVVVSPDKADNLPPH